MITTTETFSIRITFPFSKPEALHYCMLSKFESKSAQIYYFSSDRLKDILCKQIKYVVLTFQNLELMLKKEFA